MTNPSRKGAFTKWITKHPKLFFAFVVIYLISPFDLAPEAILGPLGLIDDLALFLLPLLTFLAGRDPKKKVEEAPQKLVKCPSCHGFRKDASSPCPHCSKN